MAEAGGDFTAGRGDTTSMWRTAWDKGKNNMCEIYMEESTDVSRDRVVEKAENTSFGFFNSQHSCLCLLH